MKLLWIFLVLSVDGGKRNKEDKKRDRLNKKAKKLGYDSAEEMIEKTKSNEISPWLAEVYAPQPTEEPTTTEVPTTFEYTTVTETPTRDKKKKRKERKKQRKEEKSTLKTTAKPTTTRRTTRLSYETPRPMGDRFVTQKTTYKNLNEVQSAIANTLFNFIFGQQISLSTPPPPPPNPSIARIDNTNEEPVDEFILSEQGYIEMADDSSLLDFPFRRDQSEKSFKATPICNNKSLGLELKCDDCAPGYPYVELCVQFRQNRANEAFKCKINCGPRHEVSGFNKVKCTNGVWKHESKEVEHKTCTKKT